MSVLAPLFVCGTARGGTTLLLRLLDGHPALTVLPTETQLYPSMATRPLARLIRIVAETLEWKRLMGLVGVPFLTRLTFERPAALADRLHVWVREYPHDCSDPSRVISRKLSAGTDPRDYWNVVVRVFLELTRSDAEDKRYWVEKTPSSERYAAVSDRGTRDTCRYIHILRDPRDVVASTYGWVPHTVKEEGRERTLVRLCHAWSRSVEWCRYNLHIRPARYHVLRYEDLVVRTDEVMADVCRFLDIPMDDRVLTPTRFGEPIKANSSYADVDGTGVLVPAQVHRFKEVLTENEISFVQHLLGAQMASCGYDILPDKGTPLSPSRIGLRQTAKIWKVARTQRHYAGYVLGRST